MQENTKKVENNSGQGSGTVIPQNVKKFCWGAFFLTWIWGIFNKTFIILYIYLAMIVILLILHFALGMPIKTCKGIGDLIGLGLCIWFGIKGNEWAWQNKHWNSIKHFHDVQKKWAIAGVILLVLIVPLFVFGVLAALILPSLSNNLDEAEDKAFVKKSLTYAYQAFLLPNENRCELSSAGLASCAGERTSRPAVDNKIMMSVNNNSYLEFTGDGGCSNYDSCYIKIVAPNVDEKIGLQLDENGNVILNKEDAHNILQKYQ